MRLKITVILEKVRQPTDDPEKVMPKVDASTYLDSHQGFMATAAEVGSIFANVWNRFRAYESDFRKG